MVGWLDPVLRHVRHHRQYLPMFDSSKAWKFLGFPRSSNASGASITPSAWVTSCAAVCFAGQPCAWGPRLDGDGTTTAALRQHDQLKGFCIFLPFPGPNHGPREHTKISQVDSFLTA